MAALLSVLEHRMPWPGLTHSAPRLSDLTSHPYLQHNPAFHVHRMTPALIIHRDLHPSGPLSTLEGLPP